MSFWDAFWYPLPLLWQLLETTCDIFGEGCSICAAPEDFKGFCVPGAPPAVCRRHTPGDLPRPGKTAFGLPGERFYLDETSIQQSRGRYRQLSK